MTRRLNSCPRRPEAGMTLLELILSCSILLLLASAALPVARFTATRQRENQLKRNLRLIREAIDRYKDLADHGQIRADAATGGYPPDLQTLVRGVPLVGLGGSTGLPIGGGGSKTIRFLRSVPVDPMTGQADWGLRGVEDDPDSTTWSGKDVFDVYSQSYGTAMDGTKYSDW